MPASDPDQARGLASRVDVEFVDLRRGGVAAVQLLPVGEIAALPEFVFDLLGALPANAEDVASLRPGSRMLGQESTSRRSARNQICVDALIESGKMPATMNREGEQILIGEVF